MTEVTTKDIARMTLVEELRRAAEARGDFDGDPDADLLTRAADEIQRHQSQLGLDERDAARYRWLRGDVSSESIRWRRWEIRTLSFGCWDPIKYDALDRAVDAAIKIDSRRSQP